MASDIVPIQLSLTDGDLVTLWAPRWREDGEEWEAFLGDDDALFAFPAVAQLAAFVRTATEHDLVDHPAWSVVPDLTVAELTPEQTRSYDIVGVPELAAEDADTWTIGELAEITDMVRSLAEVCDLETVTEILDSAPGFALLHQGTLPFVGREGNRLWTQLVETIAERWDDVIDALDQLVDTPEIDATALATAEKEAEVLAERDDADEATTGHVDGEDADDESDAEPTFWEEVGIDPIRITTAEGEYVTLRCYLDDKPVFLGSEGTVTVFGDEDALARWLAGEGVAAGDDDDADGETDERDDHDLVAASTWPEVLEAAEAGDLEVVVDGLNSYVLSGIDADITEGTLAVDASQIDLAAELLLDVGEWAGDDHPKEALADREPLGWLVSFVVRPDPTRLAPSAPFDAEATRWRELVAELQERLDVR